MDKAPVKIKILPFQLEQLPPPHAGKQGHPHKVSRLIVMFCINSFYQVRQLLRVQVLSSEIVHLGHLYLEAQAGAQPVFHPIIDDPLQENQNVLYGLRF